MTAIQKRISFNAGGTADNYVLFVPPRGGGGCGGLFFGGTLTAQITIATKLYRYSLCRKQEQYIYQLQQDTH